jgi:aminobenzoyl-glutamate utilization protein A
MEMTPHDLGSPSDRLVDHLGNEVAAIEQWLVETRRLFHRHPELGWQEIETTRRIAAELSAMGYDVVAGKDMLRDAERLGMGADRLPGEGDTGCIAIHDSGRPGPTICLRVDIDALPIGEAVAGHRPAAEGWASANDGVMHACGHDGHIAIGLGVARILRPLLERASGKLMILFQPAEEGGRGARAVADAGWMDGVDLFLAVHVGLGLPTGTVALGVGDFLATRKYRVTLDGRPAHAGKSPQLGRSALLAACQTALGLHTLAQSSEPNIRVNVGVLNSGVSANIVPGKAVMDFEIRASANEALDALDKRCRAMIASTAAAHEVESAIALRGEAGAWQNPDDVAQWARTINDKAAAFPKAVSGFCFGASEDATILAGAVAARGGMAGIFVLGSDLSDGHHTPHFDFDEAVLPRGVLLLSSLAAGALQVRG